MRGISRRPKRVYTKNNKAREIERFRRQLEKISDRNIAAMKMATAPVLEASDQGRSTRDLGTRLTTEVRGY